MEETDRRGMWRKQNISRMVSSEIRNGKVIAGNRNVYKIYID